MNRFAARLAIAACILVTALVGAGIASAAPILISNGSFETSYPGDNICGLNWYTVGYVAGCTATIPGWTVGGGGVDWHNAIAQDGVRAIDLNGGAANPAGTISQSIATAVGVSYVLNYYYAANPECETGPKTGSVTAGSASQSFSTNTSGGFPGWQPKSLAFTASASSTTIKFTGSTPQTNCGSMIDNVVVTPATMVFTSDANVDTWDPILPASVDPLWPTTVCVPTPAVGLGAAWANPHKATDLGPAY